ncbi:unnamed protein product [Candida verbasci]|uniref:uroporphyrinogen-III C-methyltransferase n=1 Tax=Candida verbasci TaxID=1227364 RepID=A0A9W4TTI6_9ASCO|nr:unnamed protein product [Candida verbasci]
MPNLLASLVSIDEVHLLIGYSSVTNLRISSIIESGARPIIIIDKNTNISPILNQYKEENKLQVIVENDIEFNYHKYLTSLGRDEVDFIIDRVFVTLPNSQESLKQDIFNSCKRLRIPINTTDSPNLCTFTLLSTYTRGDFQFGVTTSGKGCKLASRIKREMATSLPSNIDEICNKVGELRSRIQMEDKFEFEIGENEDDAINSNINSLIKEFQMTPEQIKLQRNRWLSQVVEYFPLNQLSNISLNDLTQIYKENRKETIKTLNIKKKGIISLIGSGPGSISLLTLGALNAICSADLILADKLVQQQVLDLIPRHTEFFIARKFPGNAEKAQEELLDMGLNALNQGKNVIRLKQGDPYIFGRGGEEFNFFSQHGYTPVVIPGISSAFAAPVLSGIPMTHRNVADQVLICTGTGRKGVVPNLPEFVKSRTTVFLMALHRIAELIPVFVEKGWDDDLPVAIVERASCPDQRIIRTTLKNVDLAVESLGCRPPGLLVTGYACEVLHKNNDEKWTVEEGFNYDTFDNILKLLPSQNGSEDEGKDESKDV